MNTTINETSCQATLKVMLDSKAYTTKPDNTEVRGINYRIKNGITEVTIEELADALQKGQTFMPGTLKEKNGVLKRSNDNWYSQQVVALDFDSGLKLADALNDEYIRSNASFLYTTFSHTEVADKFRVVFVLDKEIISYTEITNIIEYLLNKYPQADKSCKDGCRLFYGGSNIHWFDNNNRLQTEQILKESLEWDRKNNLSMSHPKTSASNHVIGSVKSKKVSKRNASNIEAIINNDVAVLKSILNTSKVALKLYEVEDYLKTIDMPEYLGVSNSNSFIDIFHDETKPSASMYRTNNQNRHWLYKCFSESNPFIGSIIEVTAKLQNCDRKTAKVFLCDVYNIEIINADEIKVFKNSFYEYLNKLVGHDIKILYPNLYKVMARGNCLSNLIKILSFVSENIDDENGLKILSFHKMDTLAMELGISKSAIGRKIGLFTFFGFINNLSDNEISGKLLNRLNSNKNKNKNKYRSSVYEFPILSHEDLLKIDADAVTWLENNLSIKTVNYEGIYRSFGKEKADKCFPQDKGKEINEKNDDNVIELHKTVMGLIEFKGWTTLDEIINDVQFKSRNYKFVKQQVVRMAIKEMLDMYDLEIISLNKNLKEEMGITVEDMKPRSFPKIIRRR